MIDTGIGKIPGAPSLLETAKKAGPIVAQSAVDTVQDVATGLVSRGQDAIGALVGGINKLMPSILPTATAALASLSFRGTQGNFSTISYPIVLRADFLYITGINPGESGYPLCRRMAFRDMVGFAQFKDVNIPIADGMTMTEATAIEEMLSAGVFFEWGGMD